MDGLKMLKRGFDRDCNAILNKAAEAIAARILEDAGVALLPPTGRRQDTAGVRVNLAYTGELDGKSKSTIQDILRHDAAEMVRMLKQVGLG